MTGQDWGGICTKLPFKKKETELRHKYLKNKNTRKKLNLFLPSRNFTLDFSLSDDEALFDSLIVFSSEGSTSADNVSSDDFFELLVGSKGVLEGKMFCLQRHGLFNKKKI